MRKPKISKRRIKKAYSKAIARSGRVSKEMLKEINGSFEERPMNFIIKKFSIDQLFKEDSMNNLKQYYKADYRSRGSDYSFILAISWT